MNIYEKRQKISLCLHTILAGIILLSGGCASIGKVTNPPVQQLPQEGQRYSFKNHVEEHGVGDVFFLLAFSGGGTRAAALSYGVLEELADTSYEHNGSTVRLLDEVDRINGVSGGSFTAAYYGLFGDKIFKEYKDIFLYKDIEGELTGSIFNIFKMIGRQFSRTSRTEDAIRIYDKQIFKGKTFADLLASDNPFILINATDLTSHDQFFFTQDYFDFFCSDLTDFKVARAAAASSAVPIVFEPVLIEKHYDCNVVEPEWLIRARERAKRDNDIRLQEVVKFMGYYLSPDNRPFANLVDGGVTDNLGLRAALNNIMLFKNTNDLAKLLENTAPFTHMVVLIVNASTTAETEIGISKEMPSIIDVLTAVTDIQLHKYNLESKSLVSKEIREWTSSVSVSGREIIPYYIELSIDNAKEHETMHFFNTIPTSFTLEQEQVDLVISTGKNLLRQNPEYMRLLDNLGVTNQ